MYRTACICPSMRRLFFVNLAVRMGHAFFHVFDDSRHEVIDEDATEYIPQFILADLLRGWFVVSHPIHYADCSYTVKAGVLNHTWNPPRL